MSILENLVLQVIIPKFGIRCSPKNANIIERFMMSGFDECISSPSHKLEFAFLIQTKIFLIFYLFIDEDGTVICSFRKYNRFNICIYHPFKRNFKTLKQNCSY